MEPLSDEFDLVDIALAAVSLIEGAGGGEGDEVELSSPPLVFGSPAPVATRHRASGPARSRRSLPGRGPPGCAIVAVPIAGGCGSSSVAGARSACDRATSSAPSPTRRTCPAAWSARSRSRPASRWTTSPPGVADQVVDALREATIRGRRLQVRRDTSLVRPSFAETGTHRGGEHDCAQVARHTVANVEGSAVTAIVATARTQVERVFPRGAIILSVLSFAYFGMGIIRNRVFANTYGADVELDAYNAAFRIPEVALDVLVAAGLAAPFVPIYSRLRHDDSSDRSANEFGQTILTGAVGPMTVASIVIFLVAPLLPDLVVGGFDPATKDLYVQLLRINCVAQVLFAASFALGEILVADRRFAFYAFAPILYSAGIILGTVLFGAMYGIVATAWGAVAGAAAHLAIRAIGTRRTTFRIRPRFAIHTAAFAEFIRLMVPRMFSVAIEPLTLIYFTSVATGLGAGAVSALNFGLDYQVLPVSLIGVSFSLAVFPVLSAAFADDDGRAFRSVLGRNLVTIAILTGPAAIALFVLSGVLVEVLLGGGKFGPDDVAQTSAVVAAFALSVPFDALAYPLSRGLYATHDTLRQVIASFAGLGVVVVATQLLAGSLGLLAIPFGYAAGVIAKDILLAIFLVTRVRRIGVSFTGLMTTVGTTAMYRPSRSG